MRLMPSPSAEQLRRTSLTLLASMAAGALAGAIAGWSVVPVAPEAGAVSTVPQPTVPSVATSTSPGSSSDGVTIIPLDRRPQASLLPAPFAERRSSPVAGVYRRTSASASGGLLTDDRLIGQAVAVTSDGWFVAPASVMDNGLRVADALFWHDGRAATATRAVLDHVSGVVFFKTPFTNLDAPSFARASDVTPGLAVWIERRTGRLEPSDIEALSKPLASLDGISSETTARRGYAQGITSAGDIGSPVWSSNGALVGLAAGGVGTSLEYIPSSAWAASLASLLSQGEIRHAYLGVRAVELAWARFDGSVRVSSERGAWIRDDVKQKKLAVEKNSPAAAAGLNAGDVITQVDRDILDGSADLGELLADYHAGSSVTFTVTRGAQVMNIPVQLGSVVTSEELK